MLDRICNCLTAIAISIIVAFIFSILFYTGIIVEISIIFIFSTIFSFLSLLLVGLLGISDNGLTRNRLCQNFLVLMISILGNLLFSLLALTFPIATASIASTIIVGIAIFFFIFNLINIIIMLLSIIRYN